MSTDLNNVMIEVAEAASRNGWYVVGYHKERHRDGTVPGGHIAFIRDHAPFEDQRAGTAAWGLSDLGVHFHSGHYDMTRDVALADLDDRKR